MSSTANQSSEACVLHARVVSGTGGGPEKTILSSAAFLRESGFRSVAAYIHPSGDDGFDSIRKRASQLQSPLVAIPERGPLDPRSLIALWRLCRKEQVMVWHGHDYKSNLFGLMLKPLHRKMKLVTTVHGWVVHTSKTPMYYRVDRACLPRYDRVICVSDDLFGACNSLGVRSDRLDYIPNAIDVDLCKRTVSPDRAKLRKTLEIPTDRFIIGAMGRLMPEKSFDQLIEVTGTLIERGLDVELWIAGDGPRLDQLNKLVEDKNLPNRVRLLGFVEDTREFYEAIDMYALSSQREGLPNVILEAAAMRLPILSTRVAGIPKMLTHGDNALLCDIGDTECMVSSIERIYRDRTLRTALSESARQLIEAKYSFRHRMDRIAAIYHQLLQ